MPSPKRSLVAALLAFISFNATAQVTFVRAEKEKPAAAPVAQAVVQYSIGDPTDDEQMHLELINRARADANAEAQRLIALSFINTDVREQFQVWSVNTNLMIVQFATNPPAGPLSFNANLINAARLHSQFQFDTADQTHTGSGGSDLGQRATLAGYVWSNLGENVFTNATSAEQGHAAFDVDWGPGPGGMQIGLGHRNSIHNPNFLEVGIGIVKGYNVANGRGVGPQVITEDFGRQLSPVTFVTGVAYYDINGNNFYDIGEGLPGVRMEIDGIPTFAVTSTSGAYSIPVPANGVYNVRFNLIGAAASATATVTANNAKIDFKPTYIAPTAVSRPKDLYVSLASSFTVKTLPGATGYRARLTELATLPVEGAEGPLTVDVFTDGYTGVSTFTKASGTSSFHLEHVPGAEEASGSYQEIIEFKNPIYVQDNTARIDFKSRMAIASTDEFGSLQISEDDGANWTPIWTQVGLDQPGESAFSAKTASLAAYAGKVIRVRFVFDILPLGQYYGFPPTQLPEFNLVGWYLDDIAFASAKGASIQTESPVSATTNVDVTAPSVGTYLLQFQAIAGQRAFAYGPAIEIAALATPPQYSAHIIEITPTTLTLEMRPITGATTTMTIESAPSVTGPWTPENVDVVWSPGSGLFHAEVPRSGDIRFYRAIAAP